MVFSLFCKNEGQDEMLWEVQRKVTLLKRKVMNFTFVRLGSKEAHFFALCLTLILVKCQVTDCF